MSIKYLLPCSCGQKITIQTTQAGDDIQCSCGKTLTIPTMQGIRRLEQCLEELDESRAGPSYGGWAVGLALLGLVIGGTGGALMYRTYVNRPILIDMDMLSPLETWWAWLDLQEGVQLPEYTESTYMILERSYNRDMIVRATATGVGIIMLACAGVTAILGRSRQRRRAQRRRPAPH